MTTEKTKTAAIIGYIYYLNYCLYLGNITRFILTLASYKSCRYGRKARNSCQHHCTRVSFSSTKSLHQIHTQTETGDLHDAHKEEIEVEVTAHVSSVKRHTVVCDTHGHPGGRKTTIQ